MRNASITLAFELGGGATGEHSMRLNRFLLITIAAASLASTAAAQSGRDRPGDRDRAPDRPMAEPYRGPDRPAGDSYYDRQCDNRPGPQQADCARQALANADRQLNDEYQRLLRAAQIADRPGERRQQGWYSQETALRTAQRAWIGMRDADCRFLTQPDINRRVSSLTYTMCLVERTEDRTASLREMTTQMADRRGPGRRL
jgi:uncharacterized protein YecT (DUF1311 family)